MSPLCLLALDLTQWETWAVPLVGLTSASLMLAMGKLFLRSQRPAWHPILPRPSDPSQEPDPFDRGSPTEKRTSLRRRGNAVQVWISDEQTKAEPIEGWVIDRSLGGLGLMTPKEIKKDEVITVRTINAPNTIPWVQVRVRRSASVNGGWELGCQFIKTPTWGTLLLFG
jgi:hypothetical protein